MTPDQLAKEMMQRVIARGELLEFITYDSVSSVLSVSSMLSCMTDTERPKAFVCAGYGSEAAKDLARDDEETQLLLLERKRVSAGTLASCVGWKRLIEDGILSPGTAWGLLTSNPFWTVVKEDPRYDSAKELALGILGDAHELKFVSFTDILEGSVGQELSELSDDHLIVFGRTTMQHLSRKKVFDAEFCWTSGLVAKEASLPTLWKLVVQLVASPLKFTNGVKATQDSVPPPETRREGGSSAPPGSTAMPAAPVVAVVAAEGSKAPNPKATATS
jgi:hypothetical protein